MKKKRIFLGIILSPIVIPVLIAIWVVCLWVWLLQSITFVITGETDRDDGGR